MRLTAALGLPMVAGQMMQVLMHAIDATMVARLGVAPLASAAVGNNAAALFFFVGVGVGSTVPVLAARAYGAGDRTRLNLVLRHGLTVSLTYAVLCSLVFASLAGRILPWFGPAEVAAAARPYAVLLILSLVPALLLQNLRGYTEAQNRPWLPLVNILLGVVLNVILNLGLIYGRWGLPALGLTGAGLGTLLARFGMLAHFAWILRREPTLAPARGVWRPVAPRGSFYGEYFRLAVPSALIAIVLIGNMVAVALLMGRLGSAALAANEITRQVALLSLTLPMSLSWALAIRIGQAAGKGDAAAVRRISRVNVIAAGASVALIGLTIFGLRHDVPRWFVGSADGGRLEVATLAAQMLAVVAWSVVADGVVLACLGVFRGLAAARTPAAIYAGGLWLVGLPLGYALGLRGGGGGVGVWTGLLMGNTLAAVALAAILAGTLSGWRPCVKREDGLVQSRPRSS